MMLGQSEAERQRQVTNKRRRVREHRQESLPISKADRRTAPTNDPIAVISPILIFSNAAIRPATSPLRSKTPVYMDPEKRSILRCRRRVRLGHSRMEYELKRQLFSALSQRCHRRLPRDLSFQRHIMSPAVLKRRHYNRYALCFNCSPSPPFPV